MGCGWSAPDTDYKRVHVIEAINGGSLDGPRSGISFWQDKLNRGYRLTGIGGSDNHDTDYPPQIRSAVGHPTTVVYAQNLSEPAILNAIRAGHVFIDMEGIATRTFEFSAHVGSKTASMGDAISSLAGEQVHFTLKLVALEGAHPEVIRNGELATLLDTAPVKAKEEMRSFAYSSDGKQHWLRVNLRPAEETLLLVGNPIYLNF